MRRDRWEWRLLALAAVLLASIAVLTGMETRDAEAARDFGGSVAFDATAAAIEARAVEGDVVGGTGRPRSGSAAQETIALDSPWSFVTATEAGTPTAVLGDIPGLLAAYRWNAPAGKFDVWRPAGPSFLNTLSEIAPGDAVWLRLSAPSSWTRRVLTGERNVVVADGWSTIGWTGPDAPATEVVRRLGAERIVAFVDGEFASFNPDLPSALSRLSTIGRGQALWVHSSGSRSVTIPDAVSSPDLAAVPPITFRVQVSEEEASVIQDVVADVFGYFAPRLGPPPDDYRFAVRSFPVPCLTSTYSGYAIELYLPCRELEALLRFDLPRTYAERLQEHYFRTQGCDSLGLAWLALGTPYYVAQRYADARGVLAYEESRKPMLALAQATQLALGDPLLNYTGPCGDYPPHYRFYIEIAKMLGVLAVERLVERSGDDALGEYFTLSKTMAWSDAFAAAFGLSVEDFYREFAEYRRSVTPEGLAQTDTTPERHVVMNVADGSLEGAQEVWADWDAVRRFYLDRSGLEVDAAIVYTDLTPALYRDRRGHWDVSSECGHVPAFDVVMYLSQLCIPRSVTLAHEYFHLLQRELGDGVRSGRRWMIEGSATYMEEQFLQRQLRVSAEERRPIQVRLATWEVRGRDLDGSDADFARSALHVGPYHVGFLAVEWLVERAGEEAILQYFQGQTFSQLFGLTEDEFYAAFGPYLRDLLEEHASSR